MSPSKPRKSSWQLDPQTVLETFTSSHSCKGKARHSRALDPTGGTLSLTHTETGITVTGEIAAGHHSKSEMRELKAKLRDSLFAELTEQVARNLRVAGR